MRIVFLTRAVLVVAAFGCGLALIETSVWGQDGGGIEVRRGGTRSSVSAEDWASIRRTYDAARHAVELDAVGHRARNPGQQWTAHFDGRGVHVTPDAGEWTWGIELQSYGVRGMERVVTERPRIVVDGQRLEYEWSDLLTEWFINDRRGLEHGFTVHGRPEGSIEVAPLVFDLRIRGALRAILTEGRRSVRFHDDTGAIVLSYSGLVVFDAGGRDVSAWFESDNERLRLLVDDRDALYPLTIDPVAHQFAYVKASNPDVLDRFGHSVAVWGDTVVVGATGESSNATGANGDGNDNSAGSSGAVYVFVRNGATWSQQAYIKASNSGAGDRFGTSVSVFGDTMVVGASGEASNATGVNGDQTNNTVQNAGAAYVFARSGTTWVQQAYLKAGFVRIQDLFGASVSVSGDTVVVGAPGDDSNATGVNGSYNNLLANSGAAYVFVRNGTTWSLQAYLKASNAWFGYLFGWSVAISGETIVVGAFMEASNATGVNGNENNNLMGGSGAAYIFFRNGATWSQQAYLKASNTSDSDNFGVSVAVWDDIVVIGAPEEDSQAAGVNGDESDNSAGDSGAAYVFVRNGMTWTQQAYLKASNTDVSDRFGDAVAVSENTIVVGAWHEDSNAIGINGDDSNNSAGDSGAAYVFVRNGTSWTQKAYLKASNSWAGDGFGHSVAVFGDTVVAGAPFEDSSATGVNGDDSNNAASAAGAAYIYTFEGSWSIVGAGLAGAYGVPAWTGYGTLGAGSLSKCTLRSVAPFASAFLFVALSSTPASFAGGTLVAFPYVSPPMFFNAGIDGAITMTFVMPPGVPSQTEIWTQWAVVDDVAPFGWALSNGLCATTP